MKCFVRPFLSLFLFCGVFGIPSCANGQKEHKPFGEIHEGIVSTKAQIIELLDGGNKCVSIGLSEPTMIAQAENEEPWGFFQFPSVSLSEEGFLIVSWKMTEDSYKSYGDTPGKYSASFISKDGGITWSHTDGYFKTRSMEYNVFLNNGDYIQVKTPKAKKIDEYDQFPTAVFSTRNSSFYLMDSLPDDLKGIYLFKKYHNGGSELIHAELNDPGLIRSTTDGYMSIVWWGDIKQLADGSLVAGVYPTIYQDSTGKLTNSSVSFYRSEDEGLSWTAISRIPFVYDGIAEMYGDKRFDEPTFEILEDSTFLCVMRTGSTTPMYRTFSKDKGHTWTKPEPFTPNGVLPRLFLLKNGVLVLVSGRPGIQLRFSIDGSGQTWTEPIDMIPYTNEDGSYTRDVSCGYAAIIKDSDISFYLVYSDFTKKNAEGQIRKSIWCRKITVNKKLTCN